MKLILDNERKINIDVEKSDNAKTLIQSKFISEEGYDIENSIVNAKEPSELGEVITELNSDDVTSDLKMSKIDMKSRLHPIEISAILCVDTLVSMEFLPESCLPFTRQKKRLAVSSHGAGRDDIVKIVAGKRELDKDTTGQNVFQKMGGFFTGK